jgi:hypothetical protein
MSATSESPENAKRKLQAQPSPQPNKKHKDEPGFGEFFLNRIVEVTEKNPKGDHDAIIAAEWEKLSADKKKEWAEAAAAAEAEEDEFEEGDEDEEEEEEEGVEEEDEDDEEDDE